MLYGFTDRGCLRRRILITCMTSWTSPFSRSLNRSPMTPSETYSTRPSSDDRAGVLFEGDEDGLLPVDQPLHQELQRERRLPGPERTEDRDDVPRRHAATEHRIEAVDAREHESAGMSAVPRVRRGRCCFRFGDCPTSGNSFHVHDDETMI